MNNTHLVICISLLVISHLGATVWCGETRPQKGTTCPPEVLAAVKSRLENDEAASKLGVTYDNITLTLCALGKPPDDFRRQNNPKQVYCVWCKFTATEKGRLVEGDAPLIVVINQSGVPSALSYRWTNLAELGEGSSEELQSRHLKLVEQFVRLWRSTCPSEYEKADDQ